MIGFLGCSLWACGQAGPLYLPQDTEAQTNDQTEENTQPPQASNTQKAESDLPTSDSKVVSQSAASQTISTQQ